MNQKEESRFHQLVVLNKNLTNQSPFISQKTDCHIQIIDLDGVEHKFSFKMGSDSDFWEGGKVGNISFDLNYFTDEEDVEFHHIGVYIQRLDGTYDTIFPFLRIPLKNLREI